MRFFALNNKLQREIEKILDFNEEKIRAKHVANDNFMTLKQQATLQKIKNAIAEIAQANDISPQLLTTTKELKSLILQHQKFDEVINGWRADLFGKQIKELLEKKAS